MITGMHSLDLPGSHSVMPYRSVVAQPFPWTEALELFPLLSSLCPDYAPLCLLSLSTQL